jgi:hypothetical protein
LDPALVRQSSTASLLKIDADTGVADQVAVVRLAPDLGAGTVVAHLTHEAFSVPTTIDKLNGRLYLPNARFGVPSPDTATYQVVGLGEE